MPLKTDIEKVFKNAVKSEATKEEVIKDIVSAYETSVKSALDQYGNKWTVPDFSILEKGIESQFDLAFNTEQNLQFSLIEASLIATWATATLKITPPAIPAPGMSLVNSGVVLASTPPGTPALPSVPEGDKEATYDNIVNSFNNMFVNHAKTISYNYIGTSTSAPPVPIVVPGSGITLL